MSENLPGLTESFIYLECVAVSTRIERSGRFGSLFGEEIYIIYVVSYSIRYIHYPTHTTLSLLSLQ